MSACAAPAFDTFGAYDHRLETAEVVQAELTKRLEVLRDVQCRIVVIVGFVRSGSTALQLLMTRGIQRSEFQPIKDIYRLHSAGLSTSLQFPETHGITEGSTVLLKETLGANTGFECTFDPIDMLINAGIAPERIDAVYLSRSPAKVLDSWRKICTAGPEQLRMTTGTFFRTFHENRQRIRKCIPFAYETLAGDAAGSLQKLFETLDLPAPDSNLEFDKTVCAREANGRVIHWNQALNAQYWNSVIEPILSRDRFAYVERETQNVGKDELKTLQEEYGKTFAAWNHKVEESLEMAA